MTNPISIPALLLISASALADVNFLCAPSTPAYLPDCADPANAAIYEGCSAQPDDTFALRVEHYPGPAVALSGNAIYSEHRWWEMALSGAPGEFDVAPECRDQSARGALNLRILLAPRFVYGCAPPEPGWINVRPIGPKVEDCGLNKDCRAVVFGN